MMLYRTYCWGLFFLVWMFGGHINAVEWTSRPETLRVCKGDDVMFPWGYVVDSVTNPVTATYWIFLGTGDTMAGWSSDTPSDIMVYDTYADRIELLREYNVGIQLLNATAHDTGQYKVELAGPGIVDVTYLTVYQESDLQPSVYIDGVVWQKMETIVRNHTTNTAISVRTQAGLPANITISSTYGSSSKVLHTCVDQRTCNTTLVADSTRHITLSILVQYPFCRLQQVSVNVELSSKVSDKGDDGDMESPDGDGTLKRYKHIAMIVCIVIVIIVLIAIVVLWFARRRNKRMAREAEKGVNVKSVEMKPLKKTNNKKDEVDGARVRVNSLSGSCAEISLESPHDAPTDDSALLPRKSDIHV